MFLHIILPDVTQGRATVPTCCPYKSCNYEGVRLYQPVKKLVRDMNYREMIVLRYQCLKCGRTFRVYPQGVGRGQTSQLLKEIALVLYLLGLSFSETSATMEALGIPISKNRIYVTVQAYRHRYPELKHTRIFKDLSLPELQEAEILVNYHNLWLPLALTSREGPSLYLNLTELSEEIRQQLRVQIEQTLEGTRTSVHLSEDSSISKVAEKTLPELQPNIVTQEVQENVSQK